MPIRALVLIFGLIAGPLLSQEAGTPARVSQLASQALATYGLVAVPNDTASAISIQSQNAGDTPFQSLQIGGGSRYSQDIPLYLEGYIGLQRYDPSFVFAVPGGEDIDVQARWTGVGFTGGVGYDYKIGKYWTVRPIAHFTFGYVTSDLSFPGTQRARATTPPTAPDRSSDQENAIDFLTNGSITAGGYGASLQLEYKERRPDADYDIRLRHTYLRLVSIGDSAYLNAQADAITTSVWGLARYPIDGLRVFQRPVRSVIEASIATYSGDQGALLGADWLAHVGTGVEFGFRETGFPWVNRGRIVLRYAFGDAFQGLSVRLGFSF